MTEKERLCYCSHKLYTGVSLQNMQSCFPVYQVLLQPRVMQIKACKTSRLQIRPRVRFPRSTMIIPITELSANTVFRSGCCPSICVCVPHKGMKGLCSSQQVPAGLVSDALTVRLPGTVTLCGLFLSQPLPVELIFLLPFLLLYLSTALLNHLAPGNVSDQVCTAWSKARCGWSWADANCALCCYLFGGKF